MPIPRLRPYQGPALFSYGFRPFFLSGAVFAFVSILLWLPAWFGEITIPTAFSPTDWHVHEMLFGFVPAIITGFLFTAVPNWTGRLPLQGTGLALLLVLWLAGRLAVFASTHTAWQFSLFVDGAFLPAVALFILREIIAGRNWRNLKVLLPLALLAGANILFHLGSALDGDTELARRIAIAAIVMLITIIGGRIVPSFTRNFLARENPGSLPAGFDRFDLSSIAILAIALSAWVIVPAALVTAALLFLGGMAQLARLARWVGWRAWRDPLVWILHAAYAMLAAGVIAMGVSIASAGWLADAMAFHLIGIGGIGGMTLAVMVRASLGHTGHALRAGTGGTIVFVSILLSAMIRITAELAPEYYVALLHAAAFTWFAAFGAYVLAIGPALLRKRKT